MKDDWPAGRRDDVDQRHERLVGAAWERLAETMDAMAAEASASGLTDAGLETLLADES